MQEAATSSVSRPEYWAVRGFGLKSTIARVYDINPQRLVLPSSVDTEERYDFVVVPPKPLSEDEIHRLVRQAIQDQFHLAIAHVSRVMDVYVMTAPNGPSPAIKALPETPCCWTGAMSAGGNRISVHGLPMKDFCRHLELVLHRPVVDETNFKGRYEFEVRGDGPWDENVFMSLLREKLGLTLTPDRRQVDMLVVKSN